MTNITDLTKSNDFVPFRLVKQSLDTTLLPLRRAIHRYLSMRSAAIVLDIATGGGLLAAWAAESDSVQQVYAIEDDPLMASATRKALLNHSCRDQITFVETDNLLTYEPPKLCDLLLCEVVSTGLIQQPQVPLLNHYLQFLKPTGSVLPCGIINMVTLLDFDFHFCNSLIYMPSVFEDELLLIEAKAISKQQNLSTLFFHQPLKGSTEATIQIPVVASGWARAVRLETQILVGINEIEQIRSLCQPIIAPLRAPFFVERDQILFMNCSIIHCQTDINGRASACALPDYLNISLTLANSE